MNRLFWAVGGLKSYSSPNDVGPVHIFAPIVAAAVNENRAMSLSPAAFDGGQPGTMFVVIGNIVTIFIAFRIDCLLPKFGVLYLNQPIRVSSANN